MNILHTADWHLGKKLEQSERTEEHRDFLDWLIGKLSEECIDLLIVAGDIFDTTSPPNTALELYYNFLGRIRETCCKEVIIIGGNHDSISTLNAPKELLKHFKIHVIGGVPEEFTEQIIPVKNASGETRLVVCAVPFLRDKDIRLSIAGETAQERESRIRQGIIDHYCRFRQHIADYKSKGIPVVATGHLFAAGVSTSDSEKEIHVGNLGQIPGDRFPEEFDYIALGHIHRPQQVSKMNHIRYSGSPIPLSFSETEDLKKVIKITFSDDKPIAIRELDIPPLRKLIRIRGYADRVKDKIKTIEDNQSKYPVWVEIQVETEQYLPELEQQLETMKKSFIEKFFIRQVRIRPAQNLDEQIEEALALNDLEPKTVFLKKCDAEFPDADNTELIQTFEEVLELLQQQEPDHLSK